jgi:uncharacterized membrane protein YhaH (DUF805 family)
MLTASYLWPWLLPGTVAAAVAVLYFDGRRPRDLYLILCGLCVGTTAVLFFSDSSSRSVAALVICLMAVASVYGPVTVTTLFLRRSRVRPIVAAFTVLAVGVVFIPVSGIVALLTGCAFAGDCI